MWKPTNIPMIVKAVQNPPSDRHVGPRRWGAWSIFWEGRGWGPGLFILESRELRGWENQRLFSAVPRDRTRDSEHKLKHFKFHLHYLTHEGNPTLVRRVVESPSVGMGRTHLAMVPAQRVQLAWLGLDDLQRALPSPANVWRALAVPPKTLPAPCPPPTRPGHPAVLRSLTWIRLLGSIYSRDITKTIRNCNSKFLSTSALIGIHIPS